MTITATDYTCPMYRGYAKRKDAERERPPMWPDELRAEALRLREVADSFEKRAREIEAQMDRERLP